MKLLISVGLTPLPDQVLLAWALRKWAREAAKEQGEQLLAGNGAAAS